MRIIKRSGSAPKKLYPDISSDFGLSWMIENSYKNKTLGLRDSKIN